MNFGIKRAAHDIVYLLKPIVVAINKMQSNSWFLDCMETTGTEFGQKFPLDHQPPKN